MSVFTLMLADQATNAASPPLRATQTPNGDVGCVIYDKTSHLLFIDFQAQAGVNVPIVDAEIEIYGWYTQDSDPSLITSFLVNSNPSSALSKRCTISVPFIFPPVKWVWVKQVSGTLVNYRLMSSSQYSS
jgi:hypothetical protein